MITTTPDPGILPPVYEERTATALSGSVKKWERVIEGEEERGRLDCPLCQLFNPDHVSARVDSCAQCPIAQKTGKRYCAGTVYDKWDNLLTGAKKCIGNLDDPEDQAFARSLAKKMLEQIREVRAWYEGLKDQTPVNPEETNHGNQQM